MIWCSDWSLQSYHSCFLPNPRLSAITMLITALPTQCFIIIKYFKKMLNHVKLGISKDTINYCLFITNNATIKLYIQSFQQCEKYSFWNFFLHIYFMTAQITPFPRSLPNLLRDFPIVHSFTVSHTVLLRAFLQDSRASLVCQLSFFFCF